MNLQLIEPLNPSPVVNKRKSSSSNIHAWPKSQRSARESSCTSTLAALTSPWHTLRE